MQSSQRNNGLDIVRASAIILVLIAHYSYFLRYWVDITPVIVGCGYLGVELFFSLSGFLIGSNYLLNYSNSPNNRSIINFYFRRWLRTLPLYFSMLIFLTIIYRVSSSTFYIYAFFLQNFFHLDIKNDIFGVSWSLAIEEWFYLLLPLVMYLLTVKELLEKRVSMIIGLIILIIICLFARYLDVRVYDTKFMEIRREVFQRLDALLYGVLMAAFKYYWSSDLKKLMTRYGYLVGISSILILMYITLKYFCDLPSLNNGLARVWLFSLTSFSCSLIVLWADSSIWINSINKKNSLLRMLTFISLISYSIYIIHWEVISLFDKELGGSLTRLIWVPAVCLMTTLSLASITYFTIEKPIIFLRDLYFPAPRS